MSKDQNNPKLNWRVICTLTGVTFWVDLLSIALCIHISCSHFPDVYSLLLIVPGLGYILQFPKRLWVQANIMQRVHARSPISNTFLSSFFLFFSISPTTFLHSTLEVLLKKQLVLGRHPSPTLQAQFHLYNIGSNSVIVECHKWHEAVDFVLLKFWF